MTDGVTGRDELMIAEALCIASDWLRRQENPRWSDINDMEAVLKARYPEYAAGYQFTRDLKLALNRGYTVKPGHGVTAQELRRWLEEREADANLVVLPQRASQDCD